MKIIYRLLLCKAILVLSFSVLAEDSNLTADLLINIKKDIMYDDKSKLDIDGWNEVVCYSFNYFKSNKDKLYPIINESGFYRINIETNKKLKEKFGIEKIRLNYWPEDRSLQIKEESIHNHPRYFESYIIYGGYRHKIYILDDKGYDNNFLFNYKILKGKNKNSYKFVNKVFVSKELEEKVTRGKIVIMPNNIVHKVTYSVPGSLSLNIIFNDKNSRKYYNIFLKDKTPDKSLVLQRKDIKSNFRDKIMTEVETRIENLIF